MYDFSRQNSKFLTHIQGEIFSSKPCRYHESYVHVHTFENTLPDTQPYIRNDVYHQIPLGIINYI